MELLCSIFLPIDAQDGILFGGMLLAWTHLCLEAFGGKGVGFQLASMKK